MKLLTVLAIATLMAAPAFAQDAAPLPNAEQPAPLPETIIPAPQSPSDPSEQVPAMIAFDLRQWIPVPIAVRIDNSVACRMLTDQTLSCTAREKPGE